MLSLTKQSSKKSFEGEAREWSIGVGTEYAMTLLGELHENEKNNFMGLGESSQEQCLSRGHFANHPRAGGPIVPQMEHFGGDF